MNVREDLEDFATFIRLDGTVLRRYPELLFQQAANQPASSAPARMADRRWSERRHSLPWLRWVNKPSEREPVQLSLACSAYTINCCAFTPDGRYILTLGSELEVWDAETGAFTAKLVSEIPASTGVIGQPGKSFAVSNDGRRIVADVTTMIPGKWIVKSAAAVKDFPSGETLGTLDHGSSKIMSMAYSADGRYIASGTEDQTVRVWNAHTFDEIRTFKHENRPQACAFSPDSSMLAVAGGGWSDAHTVKLWDITSGNHIADLEHEKDVFDCAFSPSGRSIVTACHDGTLRVWDVATKRQALALSGHTFIVRGCDWSHDGERIVSASGDRTIRLWNAFTGECIGVGQKHTSQVFSCAFSADGRRILSGDQDHTAIVWDAGSLGTKASAHVRVTTYGGAFSPNGTQYAAAVGGGVLLYDVASGENRSKLSGDENDFYYDCAYTPDGRRLAASSHNGMFLVWDAYSGKRLFSERVSDPQTGHVHVCAISPNGKMFATAAPWAITIFDAHTYSVVHTIHYNKLGVNWCTFSADSKKILDSQYQTWEIAAGNDVTVVDKAAAVYDIRGYSPDYTRILAMGERDLRVLDSTSGEILMKFENPESFTSCGYTPDGRWIAATTYDGELVVYDATSGAPVLRFVGGGPMRGLVTSDTHLGCGISGVIYLLEMVTA